MEFKDKFIGFVDVLGFTKMVEAAEAGTGMSLPKLFAMLKELGTASDREHIARYGPTTCPRSAYIQRDLDFQVTQVSDCVIVSAEVSPAGVINLVHHCWGAAINLLSKGIMVRGYINRGSIYHEGSVFIGSGYNLAQASERDVGAFKRTAEERGTPFIEIDHAVCAYVKDHGDNCVKEMFSRYVKGDGSVTAIFPFQRLAHSFMIGGLVGKFDPAKEKRANDNLRQAIIQFRTRVSDLVDRSNPRAVSKGEHYVAALDEQLGKCDEMDDMIDALNSPFPARRMD